MLNLTKGEETHCPTDEQEDYQSEFDELHVQEEEDKVTTDKGLKYKTCNVKE